MSPDLLMTTFGFVGLINELAGLEYRSGTDRRDELGRIDGPPPGLRWFN